jgi:site-specific DNA-methyltransferase (adenine-specific)
MALRIWYMHKVLKETGSFYLHCDPTMSHYLKIVCDMVFGEKNFRNEIIWNYGGWTHQKMNHFPKKHDVILFFAKSPHTPFTSLSIPWTREEYIARRKQKIHTDEAGREYIYDKRGNAGQKRFLDVALAEGQPISSVWDIRGLTSSAKERLGYPTQKPETLLERIIKASSNEGDLVADFCCGCGTTIAVAQRLHRQWLGVDISHLSIKLVMKRLQETYDTKYAEIRKTFEVFGIPKDIASAKALAESDDRGRFKFQDWVIEFLLSGVSNPKKTADGGWDGHMTFAMGKQKEIVLIEVKSGKVNVKNLREFIHVVNAQKAAIGVFVCFQEQVTTPMAREAKQQGHYSPHVGQIGTYTTQFPKIQILTIEQILAGEQVKIPMTTQGVFKTAGKHIQENTQQQLL